MTFLLLCHAWTHYPMISPRSSSLPRAVSVAFLSATLAAVLAATPAWSQGDGEKPVSPPVPATAAPGLHKALDLRYRDDAVRPQDDLFRHLSGKWLDTATIPPDRARFGAFEGLRDQSEARLRDIVEGLSQGERPPAGSDERRIADVYRSFMDEARADEGGLKPLAAELARIDALRDKGQIPALMAHLSDLGVNTPVLPGVSQDARDATRYAVYLSQGGLGLPDRDYYLKDDDARLVGLRRKYEAHVANLFTLAGFAGPGTAAASIVALETELAKISWTRVENRDRVKTYNRTDIIDLPRHAPGFDWQAFLTAAELSPRVDYVIARQPSFFEGFGRLVEATPLPVWKDYFRWQLLNSYAPYLGKPFVTADFDFSAKTLRGIPENRPRWKRGVALVEEGLGEALGRLYVARHFPPESKARMEKLVANLLEVYRVSISQLDWLTPKTRDEALDKLHRFTAKIGYPKTWRDYSTLRTDPTDLVGNVIRIRDFEVRREVNKLGKPVDRDEWNMTPQTVNAYYNPRLNEIVFPAAILQPPFFDPAADEAVNYGGIGAVIGHEISHGFDDQGSQSDGVGNLRDWWTGEDHRNFKRRTEALVAQYSAYEPIPGYKVNGELTLGENIADNAGLAIAYKAYRMTVGDHEPPAIDGLTGNQRFFLGWAQVWRAKVREAEAIRLIKTDPHAPSEVRCNGAVVNHSGFQEAFQVKEGDRLYLAPDKRVTLW